MSGGRVAWLTKHYPLSGGWVWADLGDFGYAAVLPTHPRVIGQYISTSGRNHVDPAQHASAPWSQVLEVGRLDFSAIDSRAQMVVLAGPISPALSEQRIMPESTVMTGREILECARGAAEHFTAEDFERMLSDLGAQGDEP